MPLKKLYRVASANRTKVATVAEVAGEQQSVEVNGLEVELVAEDKMSSSITFRFIGADIAEAEKEFVVDEVVELPLSTPTTDEPQG